jgi:drug/metabolite transporter (DMT)-like permease
VAVVKAAQSALDPWSFGCGRFALAALAFAPALPAAAARPALAAASVELGLLAAAGYAAQAWGLTATTASHTAFISAFTVVLVPLLAASGRLGPAAALPRRTWTATAIAFAGIAVLELCGGGGEGAAGGGVADVASVDAALSLFGGAWVLPRAAAGDAASFVAAALFAAQLVRTEHHAAALGREDAATAAAAAAAAAASAAAASAAASSDGHALPLLPPPPPPPPSGPSSATALVAGQLATLAAVFAAAAGASAALSPTTAASLTDALHSTPAEWGAAVASLPWGAWLFTGLISTAGTLWLEVEALRDVSAPDAALVYATEPVWGAAVAALALGERWEGPTWAGAALIVGGSLFGQLPERKSGKGDADGDGDAPVPPPAER